MADSWISSVDVDTFVQQQMQRESLNIDKIWQPQIHQLGQQQSMLQMQQKVYTQLQSSLGSFSQSLTQVGNSFQPSYEIGYATQGILNAKAVGTVAGGTHTINVTRLAQASSIASVAKFSSSVNAQNNAETLNFSIGPQDAPSTTFSVNVNATDSLQTVANTINTTAKNNNTPLTASVISTADGQYQLVVSSSATGLTNQVNISEEVTSGTGLNISTSAGSQQGTVLSQAQNAAYTYDNLSFDMASNTNTIQGLNISLANVGTTTVNVSVTNDIAGVTSAVQDVVNNYNQISTFIQQTKSQGGFQDPHLDLILSTLKTAMDATFANNSTFTSLADIGVTISDEKKTVQVPLANGNGTTTAYINNLYTVDNDKLTAALSQNFSATQSLLTDDTNGLFTNITSNLLNSGGGKVWQAINDPNSGGLTSLNHQLSSVSLKISDGQTKIEKMKNDLLLKYGNLEMTLSKMKNTSLYLAEQLKSLSGSK